MRDFNLELTTHQMGCTTSLVDMHPSATIVFLTDHALFTGLVQHLNHIGYHVIMMHGEADYLQRITALTPDMILLDEMSDHLSGFEICQQLKLNTYTSTIPVIFICSQLVVDAQSIISGFKLGGVDYLNKSMSNDEMQARINVHLDLKTRQQKLDTDNLLLLSSLNAQITAITTPISHTHGLKISQDNQTSQRGADFLELADNIPDLIVCYDTACRRTYLNRAYTERVGTPSESLIGKTPLDIWTIKSSVSADLYMSYLQRVLANAEVIEYLFDVTQPDSASLYYSAVLSPLYDNAGILIGVMAISRNITALHEILARLHKSENEFRTLAENSPEMIIRYDLNLNCIFNNPAYQNFNYAFPYLPWLQQTSKLKVCLVSWEDYSAILQQVILTGQSQQILLEWSGLDGNMVSHDMNIVAEYSTSGEMLSLLALGHDVTQLKISEKNLKESKAELRMLTIKREEAREQERKRIAREIHDELGQLLSVMRLGVSSLDMTFGDAIPYLHERVEKITDTIDHAILVARCLATRLRPAVLSAGIVYALEWMIEDYAENSSINFKLEVASGNFKLEEERAVMVFRIVQESITNAVRHSAADTVKISLSSIDDNYLIEVHDNGMGFNTAQSINRKSYGLVGMKERAMILGGILELSSESGLGTQIRLCFPKTKIAQEMVDVDD